MVYDAVRCVLPGEEFRGNADKSIPSDYFSAMLPGSAVKAEPVPDQLPENGGERKRKKKMRDRNPIPQIKDIHEIRAQFPLLAASGLVYLDNSATTQKPECVLKAMEDYYRNYNANPFRGLYSISEQATEAYEDARRSVSDFIHAADPSEIIFTRNATESLNLAAYSLGELLLKPGDEILVSIAEHHSNMLPWRLAAKRHGATVRYLEPDEEGLFSAETLENALCPKVKIAAVTHMSNIFGRVNDLKTFAEICHENGTLLAADGAQSVPHIPVDVQDLGVDFLAFSGHKMLGPMGIGVLYGKRELLTRMPPFLSGGEMIDMVTRDRIVYADIPHKFEAGTVNAADAVGLAEAVRFMENLGFDAMQEREEALTRRALEGMKAIRGVRVIGSGKARDHHGILTFVVEGVHPHDVAAIMDSEGIAVRAGHHCAQPLHAFLGIPSTTRASIMFYNTEEEIDRFLEVLSSVRRRMGYGG